MMPFNDKDSIIYVSQNKTALENDYNSGFPLSTTEPKDELLSDLHADGSVRGWMDGVLTINLVRINVYSVELTFNDITYSHFVSILNNLKIKDDGGFYASVFDDELGRRVVRHMYRSDRKFKKKRYQGGWYADLQVSIIEF